MKLIRKVFAFLFRHDWEMCITLKTIKNPKTPCGVGGQMRCKNCGLHTPYFALDSRRAFDYYHRLRGCTGEKLKCRPPDEFRGPLLGDRP